MSTVVYSAVAPLTMQYYISCYLFNICSIFNIFLWLRPLHTEFRATSFVFVGDDGLKCSILLNDNNEENCQILVVYYRFCSHIHIQCSELLFHKIGAICAHLVYR